MALGLDPNLNAWWLDRSSPNDAAAASGFRTGVQIYQFNQEQDLKRQELAIRLQQLQQANEFRRMDLALEAERNDLAFKTFQSKRLTVFMQAKGLADLNDFVANATAADKLTDPETRSGFWRITGKYAPFISHEMANSIWDNTFQEAQRRKDRAEVTGRIPTLMRYDTHIQEMEKEAKAEADPDKKAKLTNRINAFKHAARMEDPSTSGISLSDQQTIEYRARYRALITKLEKAGFDKSEKLDPKEPDSVTFDRQAKALNEEFRRRGASPSPAPSGEDKDPLGLFK